jgi:uncharacterized membrane protein YGL010W
MALFSDRSWEEWVSEYADSHRHPVNRMLHTLGIPMIILSIVTLPLALVWSALVKVDLALFIIGWIFQFIGHVFEKKPPEFFKDWRFLFVGLRWWLAKISGRA